MAATLPGGSATPSMRDRLQFEHVGRIDLRQSILAILALLALLLPQRKQHDPLRAHGAAFPGTVVITVAQRRELFDGLRNKQAFQFERRELVKSLEVLESFPKV
jgi:hypothetical protein